MSDITLTASVRSNLSTLQSTATLIGQTQERLATGKKVNSALDNPNSFFTAASLNSRASDLSNLQDDIGQSVSTLEAADKGISSINDLLDSAKAKAEQALRTNDADTRAKYAAEYNELRTQIEDVAKDSGYKGKNLLGGEGNDLNVKFNEDGSSKLKVGAVDYTDLDSENAAFKLGRIGTTVGEVKERDVTKEFTLGQVGRIPGTGSGELSVAIKDADGNALANDTAAIGGTTTGGLTDFSNDDTIALNDADGNALTDKNGDAISIELKTGDTIKDIAGKLQTALSDAGNSSARVEVDGANLKFSGVETGVTLAHFEDDGTTAGALNTQVVVGTNENVKDTKLASLDAFEVGDKISIQYGDGPVKDLKIEATDDVQSLIDRIGDAVGTGTGVTAEIVDGKLAINTGDQDLKFSFSGNGNGGEFADKSKSTVEKDLDAVAGRGWGSDELIEESLAQVRQAQLDLRAQASTFGTNLSVVRNRQDFTADMINTLATGAGKLTLADTNLEGANLSALNTQNQIATSTLALATQANQSVLQLIR